MLVVQEALPRLREWPLLFDALAGRRQAFPGGFAWEIGIWEVTNDGLGRAIRAPARTRSEPPRVDAGTLIALIDNRAEGRFTLVQLWSQP